MLSVHHLRDLALNAPENVEDNDIVSIEVVNLVGACEASGALTPNLKIEVIEPRLDCDALVLAIVTGANDQAISSRPP